MVTHTISSACSVSGRIRNHTHHRTMALANVLLLSQIAGHVVALILSLCIFVPLSLHLDHFNGHCLLFTTGEWQVEDGLFDVHWASRTYCTFPLVTGVLVFLASAVEIYRLSRLAVKQEEPSFLSLFIGVVVAATLFTLTILAAINITLGFIVWCSNMTQRFPSCELAAGQNITEDSQRIDTSGFYVEMGVAQFGAWGSFAICVGLSVIALLKLIGNHQMRNMKVSMYLERHRLMHEDGQRGFAGVSGAEGISTPPQLDSPTSQYGGGVNE